MIFVLWVVKISCSWKMKLSDNRGNKRICWSIMMMILLSSTLVFRVLCRADLICRSYIYRKFGSHFSSQQGCAASLGPVCQLWTEFMECVVMWVVLEGKLKRWGIFVFFLVFWLKHFHRIWFTSVIVGNHFLLKEKLFDGYLWNFSHTTILSLW